MDLAGYRRDNNQLTNTPLVPGGQGENSLPKCPPLNSECHAGAHEVFAALSNSPKSLRPVREIQAGDSSRQKRVGGLRQSAPGPHPQDGFGLPPRIFSPALYSLRQTRSSTEAESRLHLQTVEKCQCQGLMISKGKFHVFRLAGRVIFRGHPICQKEVADLPRLPIYQDTQEVL